MASEEDKEHNNSMPIDVPTRVVIEFLSALETESINKEVVSRLRRALLDDKAFTERALRDAIFPETFDV